LIDLNLLGSGSVENTGPFPPESCNNALFSHSWTNEYRRDDCGAVIRLHIRFSRRAKTEPRPDGAINMLS